MKKPPLAQGNERTQPVRIEPRWPVALTILAVLFLLTLLRSRARLFPPWMAYAVGMALLLPIAGVWLSGARPWWLRLERITTLCLSFSTATAFSPTDTMPLTTRAKLLMMIESAVSLATLVIVASRAINTLGS